MGPDQNVGLMLSVNISRLISKFDSPFDISFQSGWEKENDPSTRDIQGVDNPAVYQWPSEGVISFENYSTRYRAGLELTLHGITFATKPAEKV